MKTCPACSAKHDDRTITCGCGYQFYTRDTRERPTPVAVYAILLVVISVIGIVQNPHPWNIFVAIVTIPAAIGLWNLRQWARITIIVLHSLRLVVSCAAFFSVPDWFNMLSAFVGGGIRGIIIIYLATHGDHFD